MMSAWLPRKFIIIVIVVWLVNYVVMMEYAKPRYDREFVGLLWLLEWRDMEGDYILRVDRSAPIDAQLDELRQKEVIDLTETFVRTLPPEIVYLRKLKTLFLSWQISKLLSGVYSLTNLGEIGHMFLKN